MDVTKLGKWIECDYATFKGPCHNLASQFVAGPNLSVVRCDDHKVHIFECTPPTERRTP